jgi:hypothetical protein
MSRLADCDNPLRSKVILDNHYSTCLLPNPQDRSESWHGRLLKDLSAAAPLFVEQTGGCRRSSVVAFSVNDTI